MSACWGILAHRQVFSENVRDGRAVSSGRDDGRGHGYFPQASADVRLAAELAHDAGRILVEIQQENPRLAGKELGRRGDKLANEFLLDSLSRWRPGDAVLSEEHVDDRLRLAATRVWIIDPLDGTWEFARRDRVDWAVHVALWERGREITAAAVAQPALGRVHSSQDAQLEPGHRSRPLIVASGSRPPAFIDRFAQRVGADIRSMASAGAKAMAVVRGEADAYVHAGGQWEWDSAAPVGVARGAGLHASRLDGSALRYNQRDTYLPDVLICRPELAEGYLASLASYR